MRVRRPAGFAVVLVTLTGLTHTGCKGNRVGLLAPDGTGGVSGSGAGAEGGAAGEGAASTGAQSSGGGSVGSPVGSGAGTGGANAGTGGGSDGGFGGVAGDGGGGGVGTGGGTGTGGAAPDECNNDRRDDSETDVDCGGVCDGCALDRDCNYDADCESLSCPFGTCEPHAYLASVSSEAVPSDDGCYDPDISNDGSVIVFASGATNLIEGDTYPAGIVLHDRTTGMTERVGAAGSRPSVSGDGQVVAFEDGDPKQIYVYERGVEGLEVVSVSSEGAMGDGVSGAADLSEDGNLVVFHSSATNLDSPAAPQSVYLRDRAAGTTTRISTTSQGSLADAGGFFPRISPTGYVVAFSSEATDLVSGDSNGVADVFFRYLNAGTARVSVTSQGNEANGPSSEPSVSVYGEFVAFTSSADNLVEGDTNGVADIFVRHSNSGTTTRVSVASDGTEADGASFAPFISNDGRYIVFYTTATNLVPGGNDSITALVHERPTGRTERVATTVDFEPALDLNIDPRISGDGRFITVESFEGALFVGATVTPLIPVFANPLRSF